MDHPGYPLGIMGARSARALFAVPSFPALVVKATAPFAHRHLADA